MAAAAFILWYFYNLSMVYLIAVSFFSLVLVIASIIMIIKSSRKYAWILFKLSSPFLGIVFLLLVIEFLVMR
jgi:heme O synthase-like polyprenyltransferase